MNEASEEVAVQLAAQGVIGKRVDQMESGFMMALDYMIQLAEKDQDDKVLLFQPFCFTFIIYRAICGFFFFITFFHVYSLRSNKLLIFHILSLQSFWTFLNLDALCGR